MVLNQNGNRFKIWALVLLKKSIPLFILIRIDLFFNLTNH